MEALQKTNTSVIKDIIGYTYPKLQTGKEWYVIFRSLDPASGTMKRKRIKLNHIQSLRERRRYADVLMKRLIVRLDQGWNPWIEAENGKAYHKFSDVCDHYKRYIAKMFSDNIFREETYKSYLSYLKNIEKWNSSKGKIL